MDHDKSPQILQIPCHPPPVEPIAQKRGVGRPKRGFEQHKPERKNMGKMKFQNGTSYMKPNPDNDTGMSRIPTYPVEYNDRLNKTSMSHTSPLDFLCLLLQESTNKCKVQEDEIFTLRNLIVKQRNELSPLIMSQPKIPPAANFEGQLLANQLV
jgi:hypothetical protein